MGEQVYAGFWIRVWASIIDSIILLVIIMPVMSFIYGDVYWNGEKFFLGFWDLLVNYILPAIAVILFWVYRSATPGKLAANLSIVDAKTGYKPTTAQFIIRYLGYYVAMIPLFLGILWVAFDDRKQGWHDKLAGTVVIKNNRRS